MGVLSRTIRAFGANDGGATALEYGLIASLIVVLIIAVLQTISLSTISMYDLIVTAMAG